MLTVYAQLSDQQRQTRFVSTQTVAEKYNISQRTVQRWITHGFIDALQIGKKYQIDLLSVAAYLRQCEAERELR